jgi:hypothetical protein
VAVTFVVAFLQVGLFQIHRRIKQVIHHHSIPNSQPAKENGHFTIWHFSFEKDEVLWLRKGVFRFCSRLVWSENIGSNWTEPEFTQIDNSDSKKNLGHLLHLPHLKYPSLRFKVETIKYGKKLESRNVVFHPWIFLLYLTGMNPIVIPNSV